MCSLKLRHVAIFLLVAVVISDTLAFVADIKFVPRAVEFKRYQVLRLRFGRSIREKRDISNSTRLPYKNDISLTIPLGGKNLVLDLKLNVDMLPADVDERTRYNKDETFCQYIGKVRGVATSRAALSVCGETEVAVVQGTVFDGNNTFYIEPATALQADDKEPFYYIYNRRDLIEVKHECSTQSLHGQHRERRAIFWPQVKKVQPPKNAGKRSNKAVLRILFVTGASLYKKKISTGISTKDYTRQLINEVHSYYTDLGITVQYAGMRQILSDVEKSIVHESSKDISTALRNFNRYLLANQGIPYKYDVAVLLSDDVFKGIDTAGLAYVGSVCKKHRESAVAAISCSGSWFMTATTVAHEVGHLLGLRHEEVENQEISGCPHGTRTKYIMAARGEPDAAKWSQCSTSAWERIVDSGKVDCLMSSATPAKMNRVDPLVDPMIKG